MKLVVPKAKDKVKIHFILQTDRHLTMHLKDLEHSKVNKQDNN